MSSIERQLGPLVELVKDQRLWAIIVLFALFVLSIERVEGYLTGPWPHQRRGDDRYNPMALGSRSAWLAVAILLLPGLLLAVINAVVRFSQDRPTGAYGVPTDGLQVVGLGLVLFAWVVFVAGSTNVLHFGQYLRRVGLVTPVALLVCLLLGDLMLLLALVEAVR
ncbi:MAG: hypothetical protein IT340_11980 [Chloroflexi bacterium]|nr:hypothetical protein [Chloroflexota bacterium]